MKEKKDVLHYLKEESGTIEIPISIAPEQMRKRLESIENLSRIPEEGKNSKVHRKTKKRDVRYFPKKYVIAASCICLFIGALVITMIGEHAFIETGKELDKLTEVEEKLAAEMMAEEEVLAVIEYPETTYEDIYESMFGAWEEMQHKYNYRGEVLEGAIIQESFTDVGAVPEASSSDANSNVIYKEYAAGENFASDIVSDSVFAEKAEESSVEYGVTNVQTSGVEEADVVKNDGRYLYQKIYQKKDNVITQAIQIVDTQEGLKEVKRIEGFENIQEFYVWQDILVIIENKYVEVIHNDTYAEKEMLVCGGNNFDYYNRQYHEISFYNIIDRSRPVKIKTFTLKGRYDSSRISEGYYYGFSKYYAAPGEGKSDYEAYIPSVDGVPLKAEQILLPEENEGNCYLLLTSIDLTNPTKFVDTTAVVTDSDIYYVSGKNIYIADSHGFEEIQGKQQNHISLLRFAYENGEFYLQAEGEIPGNLESSFSMDEYEGNLRLVTTVNEYWFEEIKDDLTGEVIGKAIIEEKQSNALYVLDSSLKTIGKIENLAEGERVYSARFLGEIGYFVTFRQMDPLFAVDLKNPKNPEILSELKVSGFSEYLHFYGEDRLLGIGMEAEEDTGRAKGMKLSMFDISNPADVQEISKLHLSGYDHSEALYNHRAVMISVGANLFGFEMEGYQNGTYKRDYAVFTYENDQFVEVLKVESKNQYGEIYSSRGTFIGEAFYLLTRDGNVKSYDLNTGMLCDSITIEELN